MCLKPAIQGDMTLCLNRIATPFGPVPIPMPNTIQKGSQKVKFGGKPAARAKDLKLSLRPGMTCWVTSSAREFSSLSSRDIPGYLT